MHARCLHITFNIFPYLIKRERFGQSKTPSGFKGPSNHWCASGWCSTGKAKGIGKLQPSHFHTDVH